MNPVEKFFMVVSYRFTHMKMWLRVTIVAAIVAVIALFVMFQMGMFNTIGMTAEEKAAYEQQQAEIASAESAAKAAQELIDEEKRNGYKRFSSPNLTAEEAAGVNFIEACQSGDMQAVADYLNVPNVFNSDNFSGWCNAAGISTLFNYDDDNRVVQVGEKEILDKDGKVTGKKRAVAVWYANAESPLYFYLDESSDSSYGYILTPVGSGLLTDVVYDFPVPNVSTDSGEDLSSYATEAINTPISASSGYGGNSNLESNSSWYTFTFPRFLDIENPNFYLTTNFGTFHSTTVHTERNKDIAGIVIADFSDDEINQLNQSAAEAISSAVQAIQGGQDAEVIASYLAVSDIVDSLAQTSQRVDEDMLAGVNLISGVEVQRNELTSGTIPVQYNYHLVGNNTVSMNCNIRFMLTSGGECRRCATILLRQIGDHWSVVGTSTNFLSNVNSLDPEW